MLLFETMRYLLELHIKSLVSCSGEKARDFEFYMTFVGLICDVLSECFYSLYVPTVNVPQSSHLCQTHGA